MPSFSQSVRFVKEIEKKIIEWNYNIDFNEAIMLYEIAQKDAALIHNLADTIKKYHFKNSVELCSIFPAKIGLCPEDCKFCSQSVYHDCKVEIKDIASVKEVVEYIENIVTFPVQRLSLVTSGRQLSDSEFEKIVNIYSYISRNYDIFLCASLGFLNRERAKKLLQAGVRKYHNNLETSSSYFRNICSTHTQKQKLETLKIAKEAGLEVCSGGIISMGEDMTERIRLAFELRKLDVDSVPINILNPIKGTPLENIKVIEIEEIFTTLALFRIILPEKTIILAGGKENALGDREMEAYECGVNGCIIGNYLTTKGMEIQEKVDILSSRYQIAAGS
ncbi:biotin synthase BioB [Thermosyntropha sp.]|uniref:biotin synthase BioB n=1 Tax=Thermosyntropha sp. TaxID=2740820 RepID=UPI0025FB9590|nr:biotin synthase BioB [Thermosyntropha sp.]MBO8159525.1 biotin synthase BioB [Thermosyntropha sp.]